jgi:putative transposase
MVAGFHLSFDAPSTASVGLCLLHAVYDKTSWRKSAALNIRNFTPEH